MAYGEAVLKRVRRAQATMGKALADLEREAYAGRVSANEVEGVLDSVFHAYKHGVLDLDAIRQRLGLGRAYEKTRGTKA